jgi:hypothetical protein
MILQLIVQKTISLVTAESSASALATNSSPFQVVAEVVAVEKLESTNTPSSAAQVKTHVK